MLLRVVALMEIDSMLNAKLLLQDEALNYYPILIEYKGYKG